MSLWIKEITSKKYYQAKSISSFTSNYNDRIENMRNNNKISTKFDTERKENEDYFKMKLDKFKPRAYSSIDMKAFSLNSKKSTSSYDQPSADIIKWPLLKSPYFHSHASQFTKHISFMTLEGLLQIKNGGMPLFLTSSNPCQQTISGHHTNHSKHKIITSINLYSHQTHILNIPQQKKTMKHSQDHSGFLLSNIPRSHHQKHQNNISKSLHT